MTTLHEQLLDTKEGRTLQSMWAEYEKAMGKLNPVTKGIALAAFSAGATALILLALENDNWDTHIDAIFEILESMKCPRTL